MRLVVGVSRGWEILRVKSKYASGFREFWRSGNLGPRVFHPPAAAKARKGALFGKKCFGAWPKFLMVLEVS